MQMSYIYKIVRAVGFLSSEYFCLEGLSSLAGSGKLFSQGAEMRQTTTSDAQLISSTGGGAASMNVELVLWKDQRREYVHC